MSAVLDMDLNEDLEIQLNSEHKKCVINLINKIVAKCPHLTQLTADSVLFQRLVSIINLIESTLCTKDQIVLKRNSSDSQSIGLIKTWLRNFYEKKTIDRLCQSCGQSDNDVECDQNVESVVSNGDTLEVGIHYMKEDIDRDIGLISFLVLFVAHKLRQSLPRIKAYFLPEWQTLSHFETSVNKLVNFDKLLDLIQNELCIKRKELEITKSKLLSLKSAVSSKNFDQTSQKKTKLDFHSNLFSEYEDNATEETNDSNNSDENDKVFSDEDSPTFVDHSSDEDFQPKNKLQKLTHKSSHKKNNKSVRGRGRKSNGDKFGLRSDPKQKLREKTQKKKLASIPLPGDGESDTLFECEVCGKQFVKEYRLTRHSYTHLGRKQFVCDYPNCKESFDLKWRLSEHKIEHNMGEEEEICFSSNYRFECEWADCRRVFATKRELMAHEHEMHANRSQSKYSCDWPQCREIFENKIDWRKHVKTHGKITPTECGFPGCSKSFFKLDSLENHRKIHETFTLEELS